MYDKRFITNGKLFHLKEDITFGNYVEIEISDEDDIVYLKRKLLQDSFLYIETEWSVIKLKVSHIKFRDSLIKLNYDLWCVFDKKKAAENEEIKKIIRMFKIDSLIK